jgi:uncharacterized protein YhjY with autotransporter beta-barrel domain
LVTKRYYLSEKIREDKIDGAYRWNNKYTQHVSLKMWRDGTTQETQIEW